MFEIYDYKYDTRVLDENVRRVSDNKYSSYESFMNTIVRDSIVSTFLAMAFISIAMYLIYSLLVPSIIASPMGSVIVMASVIFVGIILIDKLLKYIGNKKREHMKVICDATCQIDDEYLSNIYDDIEQISGNVNRKYTPTIEELHELLEFRHYLSEMINDEIPEFLKK